MRPNMLWVQKSLRFVMVVGVLNASRLSVFRPIAAFFRVLRGDPGGIQTPDFQNRNLTFYSAELRGQKWRKYRVYYWCIQKKCKVGAFFCCG